MGHLVKDDREKETDGGGDRHPPIGRLRKVRREVGKDRLGQGPADERGQQQPGGIDPHVEAEEREEFETVRENLRPPRKDRAVATGAMAQ